MDRTHSKLFKIVLSLFALNCLSLSVYFSLPYHHQNHSDHHRPSLNNNLPSLLDSRHHFLTENRPTQKDNHLQNKNNSNFSNNHYLKPWPILPSYLPWTRNRKVSFRSCEAYFGNGFNRRIDILPANPGGSSGWFRCFFSETLRSSICEGRNVRMVPERIHMSKGGEAIEEVMRRTEEEELPEFQNGAFEVLGVGRNGKNLVGDFLDTSVPGGEITRNTMRGLIGSIRAVDNEEFECDQWIEEPTLLVIRFEYANLFHTVTDWYSAYVSSRVTELPYRPHVIFVDGHCRAPLDETWRALFSSVRYAKNFTGPVCFRHVVLSPLGYETALFKGLSEDIDCEGASAHDLWQNPNDRKTARLSEVGEMIRAASGFSVNRHGSEKPVSGHNVLFVRREDYLAHPRHHGKVESRLSNEGEVFDSLQSWASNHARCNVNLVNGFFAHMSMKEQIRAVQEASVIIGAHGAGLTHIISATPKTVILEIISSQFRRPHFRLIAQWKGLEYHAINLGGSYASPAVVIDRLDRIMKSLGC
ncbi:hypothetical protein P3X46_006564 [Hevea brasiliensis]|uniref:Glycosyltransferase 61 catalytic domain-containing protein n=1 Tax=Hevea brasiliensis TaxID=3981 RepID=A0ABQ9MRN7_HEVBR|nr:beta-1,2-xylosyltransferase [Hevea brasiliensis]KAJ9182583.1 hypothetical protein P3X46_006564 [Hevea brasiliensis]